MLLGVSLCGLFQHPRPSTQHSSHQKAYLPIWQPPGALKSSGLELPLCLDFCTPKPSSELL